MEASALRQWLVAALGAGVLMAGPAFAGDPRGDHGGGHGGGHGGHGGGHPPAPPPPACCYGGDRNVNINVNAQAQAQAQASAYASAGGYINARAYDFGGGGYRGGGGVVYVGGGGYGGDTLGGYGYGGPIYAELPARCGATASAPFGYAVSGMGRDYRNAPPVQPGPGCREEYRRDQSWSYEERREESWYEERSYEERYEYEQREDRGGRYGYGERHDDRDRYRDARRDDCRCDRRDHDDRDHRDDDRWRDRDDRRHDDGGGYTLPPPYIDDRDAPQISPTPYYDLPPEAPQRPRQEYRQEPGERG